MYLIGLFSYVFANGPSLLETVKAQELRSTPRSGSMSMHAYLCQIRFLHHAHAAYLQPHATGNGIIAHATF